MMSVEQFLAVLKEKDLVPEDLLRGVYKQHAHHVTAAELAQVLIDKGYLTPALANRLMGVEIEPLGRGGSGVGRPTADDQDIGFAPVKDEVEPRPVIGKHKSFKPGDSSKVSGKKAATAAATTPTPPPAPPPPPKPSILDKPPPSRWATSAYDRELDTSRGIVSPRLVQLAGVEQVPTTVLPSARRNWIKLLIRTALILGVGVILYIIIDRILYH